MPSYTEERRRWCWKWWQWWWFRFRWRWWWVVHNNGLHGLSIGKSKPENSNEGKPSQWNWNNNQPSNTSDSSDRSGEKYIKITTKSLQTDKRFNTFRSALLLLLMFLVLAVVVIQPMCCYWSWWRRSPEYAFRFFLSILLKYCWKSHKQEQIKFKD